MRKRLLLVFGALFLFASVVVAPMNAIAANKNDQKIIFDAGISNYNIDICSNGSGLAGSNPDEWLWSFLINAGFTKEGAAGMVGNQRNESGSINKFEGGNGVAGPSGNLVYDDWLNTYDLSGKVGLANWGGGVGHIQWSFGRRQGYLKHVESKGVGFFYKDGAIDNYPSMGYGKNDNDFMKDAQDNGHSMEDVKKLFEAEFEFMLSELENDYQTVGDFLKTTTDVEAAALKIMTDYERPANQGTQGPLRVASAKEAYEQFKDMSVSGSSSSSSGSGSVIFLDPGHGGNESDSKATGTVGGDGIISGESGNQPEGNDVFDVATRVKEKLESDGYSVVMSRDSSNSGGTLWQKAMKASAAKAAIAVSIHTDTSANWVAAQEVGRKRTNKSDGYQMIFNDTETANESRGYAAKISAAREKAEGRPSTVITDMSASFPCGRSLASCGDIAIVMLSAQDIPWVYNEFARASESGLSEGEKENYATGLYNGIKDSVSTGSNTCGPNLTGNAKIASTAREFAGFGAPYCMSGGHVGEGTLQSFIDAKFLVPSAKCNSGIDCSGFVTATLYKATGTFISFCIQGSGDFSPAFPQYFDEVDKTQAQPGDVFGMGNGTADCGAVGHTGIILTNNTSEKSFETAESYDDIGTGITSRPYDEIRKVWRYKGGN